MKRCHLCGKEAEKVICKTCEEFLKTKSKNPIKRVKAYSKFLKQDEEFNLIKFQEEK